MTMQSSCHEARGKVYSCWISISNAALGNHLQRLSCPGCAGNGAMRYFWQIRRTCQRCKRHNAAASWILITEVGFFLAIVTHHTRNSVLVLSICAERKAVNLGYIQLFRCNDTLSVAHNNSLEYECQDLY